MLNYFAKIPYSFLYRRNSEIYFFLVQMSFFSNFEIKIHKYKPCVLVSGGIFLAVPDYLCPSHCHSISNETDSDRDISLTEIGPIHEGSDRVSLEQTRIVSIVRKFATLKLYFNFPCTRRRRVSRCKKNQVLRTCTK